MHNFNSYHPREAIWIGDTLIPTKGIVIVVGPNSSGKSLLLKDIEGHIRNGRVIPTVATKMITRIPTSIDRIIEEILSEELGRRESDKVLAWTYTFAGQIHKQNSGLSLTDLGNAHSRAKENAPNGLHDVTSFLAPCLMTVLDMEARRTAVQSVGRIGVSDPCLNDIHALYKNREVQSRLEALAVEVLDMAVWLEYTASHHFQLLICPPESRPRLEERSDPTKALNYPELAREGDGFKSFIGMVMSLLLGKRPVTLIDEPELWLHPPQAYEIGTLIGNEFGRGENLVVVATHSSHLVRGILDATIDNVTIVRMNRHHDNNSHPFSAKKAESSTLATLLQKPIAATESVLDGLFTKGVVIMEGEGDRLVYQTASKGIAGFLRDVHFLTTGGNEAIPDAAKVYLELGQRTAAILDLDTIVNTTVATKLLTVFITDEASRERLLSEMRTIASENELIPPSDPVSTIGTEMHQAAKLLDGQATWGDHLDMTLVSQLASLIERIKRARRLKRGGIAAFQNHPILQSRITKVVEECAQFGLFFVPVGVLECWLDEKVKASKRRKARWSAEAVKYLKSVPDPLTEDVGLFIQSVAHFFNRGDPTTPEREKEASAPLPS